jgi:hypothetical protein
MLALDLPEPFNSEMASLIVYLLVVLAALCGPPDYADWRAAGLSGGAGVLRLSA